MGTPRWMAPELFDIKPVYSFKSNIYALGIVMWEILSRCTIPYSSINNNFAVIAYISDPSCQLSRTAKRGCDDNKICNRCSSTVFVSPRQPNYRDQA